MFRPMFRRRHLVLALVLAASACERPGQAERELAARVLKDVLAFPQSRVVSVAGGQDAAEVTLTTAAGVADVATWYRQVLHLNGWELRHDAVGKDSVVIVHAVKGDQPLWITLRRSVGGPGTTFTLIGAEVAGDSLRLPAESAAQRAGSSMSSNRIQRR